MEITNLFYRHSFAANATFIEYLYGSKSKEYNFYLQIFFLWFSGSFSECVVLPINLNLFHLSVLP